MTTHKEASVMNKCIKCGSYAFNLYKEGIDQGGLCDVHYWQGRAHRAEALAQPKQCKHQWVSAKNEVVQNGSVCLKCMTISPKEPHELAQPEQEPEWYHVIDVHGCNRFYHKTEDCPYELKTPLYTTPPQLTWVGLTDREKLSLEIQGGKADVMLAELVEQWLKEKNT